MKTKIIVGVLVFTIMFMLIGCGEETTPEVMEEGDTQEVDQKEEVAPKTETFNIGDVIKMGDLTIVVNSVRTDQGNEFIKPDEGNIYYIIDVTVENKGEEETTISSLAMFELYDEEGYNYSITVGPETKGKVDGNLGARRKMRGELAYEIPADAKGLELVFESDIFGKGQAIIKLDR